MEAVARQDTTEIRTNRQSESSAVLRGGGGSVRTRWDEDSRTTRLGGVAYFAEYLRESGFLDAILRQSPLRYTSHNAPEPADVMGTLLLAVLDGISRYAGKHGAALAFDWIRRLPLHLRPRLLRGDVGYGSSGILDEADALSLRHLFKLSRTRARTSCCCRPSTNGRSRRDRIANGTSACWSRATKAPTPSPSRSSTGIAATARTSSTNSRTNGDGAAS